MTALDSNNLATTVSVDRVQQFVATVLLELGMGTDDAQAVAALMAEADARGVDTHGVFRLPAYVRRIRAGGINLKPRIGVISERFATALVDGDNGMGHLVVKRAAEIAIDKARRNGVAWVGIRRSNHAGPAGLYARMPLKHGMVGIYMAVGSANHMPPWGGMDLLLSTNPIAIAVPAGARPPIVLDMATSNAAYGKIKAKAMHGELIPEGWMVDRAGNPLLDPRRASDGFLLPIGGAKGSGLAVMFGLLAGTLNGAAFGRDVVDFGVDFETPTNTGQLVAAVDVEAFMPLNQFTKAVDDVWQQMKNAARLPGFDEIRLPGERCEITYQQRLQHGIPISQKLMGALDAVARTVGVPALHDARRI